MSEKYFDEEHKDIKKFECEMNVGECESRGINGVKLGPKTKAIILKSKPNMI